MTSRLEKEFILTDDIEFSRNNIFQAILCMFH